MLGPKIGEWLATAAPRSVHWRDRRSRLGVDVEATEHITRYLTNIAGAYAKLDTLLAEPVDRHDRLMDELLVANGDITLRVEVTGDGPVILCVHGWPELAHSWRHQVAHFSERGYTGRGDGRARLRREFCPTRGGAVHAARVGRRRGRSGRRAERRAGHPGRPRLGGADRLACGDPPSRPGTRPSPA